jgi:hypothetical protein
MIRLSLLALALLVVAAARPAAARELTVRGTDFFLDGKPFLYTGVSFFNAIYNKPFNESSAERKKWLAKFQKYGINVLRLWGQWNNKRGFQDACPECCLIADDGSLRQPLVNTLKAIAKDADDMGMVILLAVFAQESWHDGVRIGPAESEKGLDALTRALKPHRNVVIQIWNEFSERVLEYVAVVRKADPKRLVTNSPGVSGILGDAKQNEALDFLTPHTTRQKAGRPWVVGPLELAYLKARFRKPVVDDEPARNGTKSFGGPGEETFPTDHILQIAEDWKHGVYVLYHHDMFQTPGTPAVPPHGIPDPEWSPYHREVFEFLSRKDRYWPTLRP